LATLEKLLEQKQALEDRLDAGDLSAEAALERIDNAIAARTRQIDYSQKRLSAVKAAVAKGVPLQETKPDKVAARVNKARKSKGPINRF